MNAQTLPPIDKSGRRARWFIGGMLLAIAAVLLFARLGHYAFWDDEAMVALAARGVLATGDTTAIHGANVVAYNDGILLRNLHDRATPPLGAYLTAAAFAVFGQETWAGRLPFAVCGLGLVGLFIWWLVRERADARTWTLFALGIIGNLSLFLFARQCRYYALAMFLSTLVVFLYLRWDGSRKGLLWLAAVSLGLFTAHYLNYVALYSCLLLDYLLWGRKRRALKATDWIILLLPQIVIGGLVCSVWNPLATGQTQEMAHTPLVRRLLFLWWNLRDSNRCELGIVWLLLLAPVVGMSRKNVWLVRIPIALLIYLVVLSLGSPVHGSLVAEIRYLAPTIPLWIALAVLTLREWRGKSGWLLWPVAILAFGTNLFHANWLFPNNPVRNRVTCSIAEFAKELMAPPTDPYRVTAAWITQHVPAGQTVWVVPDYMAYPLMFHAPQAIYGWQLSWPPAPQFKQLAPIQFIGQEAPEFIVGFGDGARVALEAARAYNNPLLTYTPVATLDCFWQDLYRPELIMRSFGPIKDFDRNTRAIYIFKRVSPAVPSEQTK